MIEVINSRNYKSRVGIAHHICFNLLLKPFTEVE